MRRWIRWCKSRYMRRWPPFYMLLYFSPGEHHGRRWPLWPGSCFRWLEWLCCLGLIWWVLSACHFSSMPSPPPLLPFLPFSPSLSSHPPPLVSCSHLTSPPTPLLDPHLTCFLFSSPLLAFCFLQAPLLSSKLLPLLPAPPFLLLLINFPLLYFTTNWLTCLYIVNQCRNTTCKLTLRKCKKKY